MLTAMIPSAVVLAVIVLAACFVVLAIAWGAASGREAMHTLPEARKRRR